MSQVTRDDCSRCYCYFVLTMNQKYKIRNGINRTAHNTQHKKNSICKTFHIDPHKLTKWLEWMPRHTDSFEMCRLFLIKNDSAHLNHLDKGYYYDN